MSSPSGTPFLFIRCKPYVALDHLIEIIHTILKDPEKGNLTQYFSVPFSYLKKMTEEFADFPHLIFGSDTLNSVLERSFTQKVAVRMLKNAGARFTLIGASERRYVMRESNESISLKIRRCFDEELEPILCFGESLQEYQRGTSEEVLKGQLANSLKAIDAAEISKMRMIYEAPWADRLPQRPSSGQLKQAQLMCQGVMSHLLGEGVVEKIQVVHSFPYDTESIHELLQSSSAQGIFIPLAMASQDLPDLKLFALAREVETESVEEQPAVREETQTTEAAFPPQAPAEQSNALAEAALKQETDLLEKKVSEAMHDLDEEPVVKEQPPEVPEEAAPSKVNLTTMISESGGGIAMPVEEIVDVEEEDTMAEGLFDDDDVEEENQEPNPGKK